MDMIQKIERLRKSCETLEFENNVFEKYFQREVVSMSQGVNKNETAKQVVRPPTDEELNQVIQKLKSIEADAQMKDIFEVVHSLIERKNNKVADESVEKREEKSSAERGLINFNINPKALSRLSSENKADLVMAEIDEIEHEISWQKECIQKTLNNAKATMEFLDTKYKDNIKSQAEFEREARNSISYSSKSYQAEKIERFFEEKKRMKEALAKKIILKTGTIATQIKKLNTQIQQKEEMGGVLHRVDLDQLKFENQQYQEKIEAKNKQLLEAKRKQTTIIQLLNNKKSKMNKLQIEADTRQEELEFRNENQLRLDKEIEQVKKEVVLARAEFENLLDSLKTFKVPSTMEYIQTKGQLDELKDRFKTWTRKVDIAVIRKKDLAKKWNRMCNSQNKLVQKF